MLIPRRSDSSRRSAIASSLPSRTRSAIRSIRLALLTWYGISVMRMTLRPFFNSSICATPRIVNLPRPVEYAWRMLSRPTIDTSGRKIWSGQEFHQLFGGDIFQLVVIIDDMHQGSDQFLQIVRWNIGSHTHCDTGRTIQEQVGQTGR